MKGSGIGGRGAEEQRRFEEYKEGNWGSMKLGRKEVYWGSER